MAGMYGANADQLDHLGQQMRSAADQLDAIRGEVSAVFDRTHWEGADAEYFRGQWRYRLSGLLHTAVTATREASAALARNAEQQRVTSGTDSGPVSGVLPLGGNGSAVATVPGLGADGRPDTVVDQWVDGVGRVSDVAGIAGWGLKIAKFFGPGVKAVTAASDVFEKLGPVGFAIDDATLIYDLATGRGGADTLKAGVDVGFDVAEAATAEFPPLSFGILTAHVAYDVWEDFVPAQTKQEIVHGITSAASTVADVVGTTISDDVHMVQDAAGAVGNVVSGGVNAVRNFFHW